MSRNVEGKLLAEGLRFAVLSRGDLRRALERLGYASRLLSGFEELVAAATTALPRRRARRRPTTKGAPAIEGAL